MFTDIEGSTEVAARLGDDAWKRLLERHLREVRSALRRSRGREIDTAGDGVYATFETPARAIEFAFAVAERAQVLGIRVRSGIHMGEVETIGRKAGGIAVHIGARIAALAEPGEVLVSGTVRDLVTGSPVTFAERGTFELKGVPGRWTLYAAAPLERHVELPAAPPTPRRERLGARLASRRSRAAVAALVGVALLGTALAANAVLQPRYLPGVEANSVGRISGAGNGIVLSAAAGGVPDAIAFGEGALWVSDTARDTITRLDPDDPRVAQTIRVGDSPGALAVGHGAVWVVNGNDRTVSRVSPATNAEIETIAVGNAPSGVATDERWVWVTNRLDGTLMRIDPQTHGIETFAIGTTPAGVAAGTRSVWVSDFDTGAVFRVDSESGQSIARIPVGNGPRSIAVTDDGVWVVNSRDGTVSRIDPGTNSVVAAIAVGAEAEGVAAGDAVWVTVASTSEIVRLDPATNAVVRRIAVGNPPRGVADVDGDAWFTARAAPASHRGGVLTVIGDEEASYATFDPATGGDGIDLNGLIPLHYTNDGLIGFKRVGGPEGLTLVPNLATSIPTPTDGGRTYTFTLRPGITYSDGTPVRALDVRRSFERVMVLHPYGADYLGAIEGAEACETGSGTCDLSAGIVVDDAARTATFRLREPDAEFVYKLAVPELVLLPAETPREIATGPLAATGPYLVSSIQNGELRLTRNPRFREWSREAQPDGYPNEIVFRVEPDADARITRVSAGEADSTPWYEASFSPEQIERLRTQFPGQVHVVPPLRTWFQSMNVEVPPFDNAEVRRAVNLATDRARVVEAYGGPLAGRVTCQATPPGFPGYQPYCPYTASPDAAGTWRAPDISAALNLIESADVAGVPVTVTAFDEPQHLAVGRYFEGLLDDLGFDATLEPAGDQLFDPEFDVFEAKIQMIGLWVLPAYPAPSSLIAGSFTCPDFPIVGAVANFASFCDERIDARAREAYALQATDPAAANRLWAEVDRMIVDESPAVAAFNPTDIGFVSKRVGNVQVHPVLRLLLSQVWVQ